MLFLAGSTQLTSALKAHCTDGIAVTLVLISFLAYSAAIAAVGVYSARFSQRSESDFLLAGRGLGPWVAGLSSAASAESGWVTLGLVGFAFSNGVSAYWVVPGTVLAFLFNWFVLAPRLHRVAVARNSLTITDVLADGFPGAASRAIRLVSIVILLSMLTAYSAAQFNSAGKVFEASFGWSYSTGVLAGAALVLLYTVTGGFRAIAWTDVMQAGFMIFVMIVIPVLLIAEQGGVTAAWQALQRMEDGDRLTSGLGGRSGVALLSFLTLWFGIPLGNPGQPHVMVRLMAARDADAIRRGGIISTVWVFFLFTGAVTLGLAARVHFGTLDDPERALPLLAVDSSFLPGVLGGMILAAIFAAICSTADSQLLVAASAVSHDLMKVFSVTNIREGRRVLLDRGAVLATGATAAAIALTDVRSIFDFVLAYGWAGLGAGFGPPLILVLMSPRTTGPGVAVGMVAGVATAVLWRWQFPEWNAVVYNLIPGFLASFAVTLVVSRLTRAVH